MLGRFALLGCVVLSALVAASPARSEGGGPPGMFPIGSGINGHLAGYHPIYNSGGGL